ncbi:MAG: universal stress protein [Actinomycetota bacterium]
MISRLLVGTDGSTSADLAVKRAVELAGRLGARLTVTSVCSASDLQGSHFGPHEASARRVGEGILLNVELHYGGKGVLLETMLEVGDPADRICQLAEEEGVDLIVTGNRGLGGAGRFSLGNVPDKVAHHAPCSALIVDTTSGDDLPAYRRIVVGTDGSERAGRALTAAAEMAGATGASLLVVYAGEAARGAQVLKDVAGVIGETKFEKRVVEGEPAEALIGVAQTENADLIVVGNKGMTGAARFLLGSVPDKVAHNAPCDVLIVRTS